MTVDESKALNNGTRVYWRGDAVTVALSPKRAGMRSRSPGTMGRWAEYYHGDMREIQQTPTKPYTV